MLYNVTKMCLFIILYKKKIKPYKTRVNIQTRSTNHIVKFNDQINLIK